MRILSPEKKYLYYLMISQLHEDGYTQQALQLEVSTIHSSGNVKASDKLSRLFSSCLSSVTEATSFFNSKVGGIAGRKRHGNQSAANIRAANLANLAKRRRTAGSIDSTSMLQDSIKKCVKLVTSDLHKATSDIKAISPGANPLLSQSKQPAKKSSPNMKQSSRQLFSGSSSKGPIPKPGIAPVSNSFLKGISLLKSSQLPSVTPYGTNVSQLASSSALTIGNQTPTNSKAMVPSNTSQTPPSQRVASDTAAVVRVTKNPSNDPVVIDVEANTSRGIQSTGGLQLTKPRSFPASNLSHALPCSYTPPKLTSPHLLGKKPILTVGQTNTSALKSLVSKVARTPKLPAKSSLEVVVIDDSTSSNRPAQQPVMTISSPTPNVVTTTPPRRSAAPTLTTPESSPLQRSTSSSPSMAPLESAMSPVLSTLGLQPSSRIDQTSSASAAQPRSHHSPNQAHSYTSSDSATSSRADTPANGLTSEKPIQEDSGSSPDLQVKEEGVPLNPLEIACGRCEEEDEKFAIPSTSGGNNNEGNTDQGALDDQQESGQTDAPKSRDMATADTDFPEDIFAPEVPTSAATEKGSKESTIATTSLSDALHAASDALLEN